MTQHTLPDTINTPAAWFGQVMAEQPERWRTVLSDAQIKELEAATHYFLSLNLPLAQLSADRFPLSELGQVLAVKKENLLHGAGFELLSGLPVERYSPAFAATLFYGVGAHLGSARSQNAQGHLLGQVRDTGADANNPGTRIYQTAARQSFHTDSADVVGLLCLQQARSGGDSMLVSAVSIFNRMRNECPELARLLFEPVATDRRGEVPEGAKPYMMIPVLSWYQQQLTVFYQRQYIESAQRFDGVPALSARYYEALDCFDALANDPDMHLVMRLEPGDMQFVYNHSQLHDRTAFVDWPETHRKRCLLRLWLSMAGDRELPPSFAERYGSLAIGDRGGIVTPATQLSMPDELTF